MLPRVTYQGGIPPNVIGKEEVARRVKAGRILIGVTQEELAKRVKGLGLPYRTIGHLERAEMEMSDAQRTVVARALGLPERWFTAKVEDICLEPDETLGPWFARIEERLTQMEDALRSKQ